MAPSSEPTSPTDAIEDPDVDRILRVLADGTRRRLLRYLARTGDDVVPVEELCGVVAGDDASRRAARASLRHVHLPMLADAGIVDVDWDREAVRYHGRERPEAILERITDVQR
ncbi:DUF7344 domain-containing protein [Halorarius halobius]|uniref:DUF7344 domain-containing protein n=1 Tax=Halorarius halobius TaxID=2962671 RepID=UPI0020CE213C|nr:hypothetical protein [Halorarius halobius]